MIEINLKPCVVIKHYKAEITTHTTYEVFIIHNETTGDIKMTPYGMSVDSYTEYVDRVISKFKNQMGLNEKGKKKRKK